MPDLPYDCKLRTARKAYRCTCADDVVGFRVRGYSPDGASWSESTLRGITTCAEARALSRVKVGAIGWGDSVPYDRVEVTPIANHNARSRSADCRGDIAPGDQYVEYLGESAAWQSGTRYCLPCGLATWAKGDAQPRTDSLRTLLP